MREILFRGKRIDNGEWVEGFYVHANIYYGDLADRHFIVEHGEFEYDNYAGYEVDPTTVSQFSGDCDKNGKKIFEGDIVLMSCGVIDHVMYGNGCFLMEKQILLEEWAYQYPETMEVIGNIHDNPELLKGG